MPGGGVVESPVLVGRDDFLTLAERRLAETATGAGHLLFVAGEAGIGKTRLLGAIARPAHASNFTAQVPVVSNMLAYIAEQASLGQHPGLLVRLVVLAFIDVRRLRQHFISDLEALSCNRASRSISYLRIRKSSRLADRSRR